MNWKHMLPTQLGSMGHCVVPNNVGPLVVTRGKALRTPTILRYFKLENSYFLTALYSKYANCHFKRKHKTSQGHFVVLKIGLNT